MLKGFVRLAACAASGVSFIALTGCGGAAPTDWPSAPPPSAYEETMERPELAGAAAPHADETGLAGGPARDASDVTAAPLPDLPQNSALVSWRRTDGLLVTAMRPIPNPEDLSAAERRRMYGNRYAPRAHVVSSPRRASRRYAAASAAPKPAPRAVVAAKPAPKPVAKPAPTVAVAPKPAPKPVAKAAPAPVVAAAMPAPAPVAKAPVAPAPEPAAPVPVDKFGAMTSAIQAEATKGSTLVVPDALSKGEESKVSVALQPNLLEVIQAEAAKFGFALQARKAEVTATLSGRGYEITPNGPQTARLKAGEATTFDWQVKPGAGDTAPLKAEVGGALTGKGAARSFPLVTLEQAVKPPVAPAPPAPEAKGFTLPKLALPDFKMPQFEGLPAFSLPSGMPRLNLDMLTIPGMPSFDLPYFGPTPSKYVVAVGAILALLMIMSMLSRAAAERRRREQRRRKFRTMSSFADSEPEPEPQHNYVNPMLAAAGGAVAGAAAHSYFSRDHDEPASHDSHAEPAHEEPAHGTYATHEAPAEDSHGHVQPVEEAHVVRHEPEHEDA